MKPESSTLSAEIAAYDSMRSKLEMDHNGDWVVVHGGELIDAYPTFEAAAEHAVSRFGEGPYLIRQVGARPTHLPAAVQMQHMKPATLA